MAPSSRVPAFPGRFVSFSSSAAVKKPAAAAALAAVSSGSRPIKKTERPSTSSSSRLVASSKIGAKKQPTRPAGPEFMVPRTAQAVHPARPLTCGTAVCVRTRYVNITDRCCLVLWLPARIISASGAYHYAVKYAAHLNPMFAGKVVRLPVAHIREAPRRASSTATAARP